MRCGEVPEVMFWHSGWGGGGMLVMGFGMLVFWAVVVAGVVWAIRSSRPATPTAGPPAPQEPVPSGGLRPAREILDQRLARGEITPEEYQRTRDLLGP